MGASWPVQLGATVFRNFLLKLRDGNQTLQEIFLPVRTRHPAAATLALSCFLPCVPDCYAL